MAKRNGVNRKENTNKKVDVEGVKNLNSKQIITNTTNEKFNKNKLNFDNPKEITELIEDIKITQNIIMEENQSILVYNQQSMGNYKVPFMQDFMCYYLMYSFVYMIYSRLSRGKSIELELEDVIKDIEKKISLKMLDIFGTLRELSSKGDITYNDQLGVRFVYDVIDNKGNTCSPNEAYVVDITNINGSRVKVEFSENLKLFLGNTLNNVKAVTPPTDISEFYKYYITISNPFKHLTKPYLLDIGLLLDKPKEVGSIVKNEKIRLNNHIPNSNYWTEMVLKSCCLAYKNNKIDFIPSTVHKEFLGELTDFLLQCGIEEKYDIKNKDISNFIRLVIKACIGHRYRILFIKDMNKIISNNKDLIKQWKKLKNTMLSEFKTSVYSMN